MLLFFRYYHLRFTLLEMMLTVTLFLVIISAAFLILDFSENLFLLQSNISTNTQNARVSIEKMLSELKETSLLTVDTSFRNFGISRWENYFQDITYGNKHCNHTSDPIGISQKPFSNRHFSVSNFGSTTNQIHPHNWINLTENICPIDGSFLSTDICLDGVKFFHHKNKKGQSIFNNQNKQIEWQSIIFYFPYREPKDKTFQLKRYIVYLSDLFGSSGIPNDVTLFDLWDFNGDGRLDDLTDTSVASYNPNAKFAFSFASFSFNYVIDTFEVLPETIRWRKIGSSSRLNELEINRKTGLTTWKVRNINGISKNATFTNPPQTISHGLLDIEVSTKDTNPFNSSSNETGIKTDVVRVTLVFNRPNHKSRLYQANEIVLSSQTTPRN